VLSFPASELLPEFSNDLNGIKAGAGFYPVLMNVLDELKELMSNPDFQRYEQSYECIQSAASHRFILNFE